MQIVLATNNPDKIKEIRHLLEDLPVTIMTRDDFLEFPDVDETGSTLEENAALKATAIANFCDLPALADDSGLNVDALHGAPGVYSSRYAGEEVTYADNNRKLLSELKDVPDDRRTARFRCVMTIDWNNGEMDTVVGEVEGTIANEITPGGGFGYDPLFYYPPADKTFAQMTLEEKNSISHRGRALQKIRDVIINRINLARS